MGASWLPDSFLSLFCFSGTLSVHFVAVFAIGMLLYALEQMSIWIYTDRVVRREKELLTDP